MFLENIVYYAMCVIAIIVGIYLLKKFVGCLVRTVITLILIAFLVWVYFTFFRQVGVQNDFYNPRTAYCALSASDNSREGVATLLHVTN